jgi:hypothetical protein
MSNNTFLSRDESVLINILNTMYNDNYRQIEHLQDSNNRIMGSIITILSHIINNRSRNRQGTTQTNQPSQSSQPSQSNPSTQPNTTSNRRENTTNSSINPTNVRRINSNSTTTPDSLINLLNNNFLNNFPFMGNNIENIQSYTSSRNGANINNSINEMLQSFLEPVEVFPTQSQIEIATIIARFSDIINPINNSCPISMERFDDSDNVCIIRECGHIFSTQELHSWFRTNCRCPICRYDIRTYNPSLNTRQQERNQNPIDISNNVTPSNDITNNVIPSNDTTTNEMTSTIISSNIVFAIPNMVDISGNNLNVNDISTLLFNYYTRGT